MHHLCVLVLCNTMFVGRQNSEQVTVLLAERVSHISDLLRAILQVTTQ